jgi:putative transposase
MPAKNARKQYLKNGYYHLYNRGVEKRKIFMDKQDYAVFLAYLKDYLLPKNTESLNKIISDPKTSWKEKDNALKLLKLNNFSSDISLLSYCLMPNHFHFFIKQANENSIAKFMNSLCTRYTMYFNKKYKRVGYLYQGVYKAVLVTNEKQFIYLSRYIHKQALKIASQSLALRKQPSSYDDYLGLRKTEWVHPEEILPYFSNEVSDLSYKNFVEGNDNDELLWTIKDITLEE